MDKTQMRILECGEDNYENAETKNRWIAASQQPYLGIISAVAAKEAEIAEIYEENEFLYEYGVTVFTKNGPDGEADLLTLLSYPQMELYGYVFKRELLQETGKLNERLGAGDNYEFLCRLAEHTAVFCIPCDCPDMAPAEKNPEEAAFAYAYLLRRYWKNLQELQVNEHIMQIFCIEMKRRGQLQLFSEFLSSFFRDKQQYEIVARNTAPFLILSPDDVCYGVLADFADRLSAELVKDGQAVLLSNRLEKGRFTAELILLEVWRGVIGFQTSLMKYEWMQQVAGLKFQFWFDNPAFFNTMFTQESEIYYLCQDAGYAEHIRRFYHIKNAMQFPPGGVDAGLSLNEEREYDVVFIGSYEKPQINQNWDTWKKDFYEYMLQHRALTFEEGLTRYLGEQGQTVEDEELQHMLWELVSVCWAVVCANREEILETILSAGIPVHVFGDSWKKFPTAYRENLRMHEAVSVEESLQILGHARIGLNIMSWHKAGMTERIANILLSGAVCVSDETVYLREHYEDEKELLLFSLHEIELLPDKIKWLLSHEAERRKIAAAGYRKAAVESIWQKRTEELLQITDAAEKSEYVKLS